MGSAISSSPYEAHIRIQLLGINPFQQLLLLGANSVFCASKISHTMAFQHCRLQQRFIKLGGAVWDPSCPPAQLAQGGVEGAISTLLSLLQGVKTQMC